MKTQKQVIISIGREFGSAGHEIAERIAKRYGLSLYDHNLLREVADSHNVSSEELEIFDEMKHNKFLYRTVKGMSSSPADNVALMQFNFLREKAEKRFIKEKDRKRKKYHDSHCKTKWSETHTYDLSLNSSTLGIEGSVDFLSEYIDKRTARMK